ncbi:MAG: tetratricopeptide repeat protein, partial [Myxococcota bacterium]
MTPYAPSRLWPMLLALVVLIAGALFLQLYAETHDVRALLVTIRSSPALAQGQDEADDLDNDTDAGLMPNAAAVSAVHTHAREAARRGDLATAEPLYRQEIAVQPENASLHAELGYWLLASDRLNEAKEELARALTLAPDEPRIAVTLARAHRRLGDAATAEAILRQTLAHSPAHLDAQVALSDLLRRRGAVDEALALLEQAVRFGSNETRARTLVALGRVYLDAGKRPQATEAFARAIEWAPAEVELRLAIARAYLHAGTRDDVRHAVSSLTKALELAPDLAALHSALGRAYEQSGQSHEARAAYEHALHLDPSYIYARRRLLRLALKERDYAEA